MSDQGDWDPPDDEADLPTTVRPALSPDAVHAAATPPAAPESPAGGFGAPGQAPMGQAPMGQAPMGQAPMGQAPMGQAPIGQAPMGQAPMGQAPMGQAPMGQAPMGQAPMGQAAPAAPKKKSYTGLILAGCGGCLVIVLSLCCVSGFIFYLEEGVSSSSPGDEFASYPIGPSGGPVTIESTWEGTGYAHVKVYLDLGEGAPDETRVSGRFGCDEYGRTDYRTLSESDLRLGDQPEGWILLSEPYGLYQRDGERISCDGQLTIAPAASGARIVLTERQRPSDWFSEWF